MVGLPNFLSMTTLRPLGPRVALTASVRMFTPRKSAARASVLNMSCLGMYSFLLELLGSSRLVAGWELGENSEDVLLPQDEVLLAVDLDLAAGVLAEQDPIARLHFEREPFPVVGHLAVADCDDL